MAYLNTMLRRTLERTIQQARVTAETGAADALRRLGVADPRRPAHLSEEQAQLRVRLRAHARTLGDLRSSDGAQTIDRLIEQAAYVQWHRLLFARFLLERRLLRHPEDGGDLTLLDCREEAAALGLADEWAAAAYYTARLLPGVFPPDDPVEAVSLAPEHARALRRHLLSLDAGIFAADDSLGWTYQFWRAAEKRKVDQAVKEGRIKIGATELPAVTQLFTEPYMVKFLLHNTLGAWWAGKVLAANPNLARDASDEDALRAACALPNIDWGYLRFVREPAEGGPWRPAAGTFAGWPQRAAEITYLDPCCGSGHFLVEAFNILAALRQAEEGLTPEETARAVLRDNLHGLEIDGRCVQIAAFNVALAAWRLARGPVSLPVLHIAWVGAPPPLPKSEFVALANGDAELQRGLAALHDLFRQAPLLGSLIELTGGDLVDPTRIARLDRSIAALVEKMRGAEPESAEGALAARGMADAAAILATYWVLQATNVPFLTEIKYSEKLDVRISARFETGRQNLATVFIQRMLRLGAVGGTVALVAPQIWLYAKRYKTIRRSVISDHTGLSFVRLGPNAFQHPDSNGESVCLNIIDRRLPPPAWVYFAIDLSKLGSADGKAQRLLHDTPKFLVAAPNGRSDDCVLGVERDASEEPISSIASALLGISTSDSPRFVRRFWESQSLGTAWEPLQSSGGPADIFGGRADIIFWQNETGELSKLAYSLRHLNHNVQNWRRGKPNWGKRGVSVSQMSPYFANIYEGDIYDSNCCAIVPHREGDLEAVWSFVSSEEFKGKLQTLIGNNRKVEVGNILSIEFDLEEWREIAASSLPGGLPEPYSDDPTQWLFHGHPRYADSGTQLHVALARLAGYRWPAETDPDMRLSADARARVAEAARLPEADTDGLLALVPVLGERRLADRLRASCVTAWGDAWTSGSEAALVVAACERAKEKPPREPTLEAWLRSHAARQHAKLFHHRPFLWWITDGRADGFTAVAHYHRLDHANLERLAYTMVGDWIGRLGDNPRAEAARILQQKLARILEGEPPYDIFVRWKPIEAQPIGWNPDLDDGVRLNIRPFVRAGILRDIPNINWRKDRGTDAATAPWHDRFNGARINDHTLTLADKQAARR